MKTNITTATALPSAVLEPVLGPVGKALEEVSASFSSWPLLSFVPDTFVTGVPIPGRDFSSATVEAGVPHGRYPDATHRP